MVKSDLNDTRGFHLEILPLSTKKALLVFSEAAEILTSDWYLAGGTALALQVGHRSSVDLDFFTQNKYFEVAELENALLGLGNWRTDRTDRGTLYGTLLGAKVSFIAYPFFHPGDITKTFGAVRLISPDDIAVMKIIAISQRGKKRDFIDLYWYCNNLGKLEEIFNRLPKHYPQEHNMSHILKSLAFFGDAEADPMPQVNFEITWEKVKSYFINEVPILTRKLLDL